MTYVPTKQVVDLTPLIDNLKAYVIDTDNEALAWANGGTGMTEFQEFFTNARGRTQTIFPQILVLTQTIETDLSGEILIAGWQVVLEVAVAGPDADDVATDTKRYGKAVESMISNIPSATLTANTSPAMNAFLHELETRYDETRAIPTPGFIQVFQTRALFSLTQAAY